MRTAAEDAEATRLLREFDRAVARLIELGIQPTHLRARIEGEDSLRD